MFLFTFSGCPIKTFVARKYISIKINHKKEYQILKFNKFFLKNYPI